MKKKHFVGFMAVLLLCTMPVEAYAGEWEKTGQVWRYRLDNGVYAKNDWQNINGVWYSFDENGRMQTGWIQDETGSWYYLNSNGAMLSNTWVEGKYYVGSDGAMLKNTITPDGYYVKENGEWDGKTPSFNRAKSVVPPSKAAVDAYQYKEYRISTTNNSKVIKREGYYEITDAEVWDYKKLPASYVESLKIGDTIKRYDSTYTLCRINEEEYGREYVFFIKDKHDDRDLSLQQWIFYQYTSDLYKEGVTMEASSTETIYKGSVYITEDCLIEMMDYGNSFSYREVSAEEFIDIMSETIYRNYEVTFDSNGFITSMRQFFMS